MKLIGLTGQAGSGKDHTYGVIRDLFPDLAVERLAFADNLKADIEKALGALPFDFPALREKPYTPTVRSLLQWWGTDLRRSQDEDYWINLASKVLDETTYADIVCITDVRFTNEAAWVRERGGIVVEVHAPLYDRTWRLGGPDRLPPAHASEDIDFDLDGSIYSPDKSPIVASREVVEFLGLPGACLKCATLTRHPFHDDGTSTDTHWEWENRGAGTRV